MTFISTTSGAENEVTSSTSSYASVLDDKVIKNDGSRRHSRQEQNRNGLAKVMKASHDMPPILAEER